MGDVLLQVVGLGLAGIDPLGAALLVGAIAAGAGRTKVFAFAASVFITSVVAGTAMAVLGNRLLENVDDAVPSASSPVWAYLEVVVAAVIVVWLIRRRAPADEDAAPKTQRNISRSTAAMVTAGAAFTVTSALDPTFLATFAVVGPSGSVVTALLSFTIWTLISQVLLFSLVVAFNFGAHERALDAARRWWERRKTLFTALLQAAGVIVVIALLIDASYFFATGKYLTG